ncbi:MAG: FimV/HubP family polar landmark protein, partial [Pseudomonadota bacterium]|nr:FimV/HubP family polar landmark protein [Pseudomonadota bacterium]
MVMPSAAVYALGMGEIEVHSALNEPLKAQIRLLSTTAAELSALRVALASNEAFSRMGIERTAALRDLRFGVVTQGAGAPYITILSDTPIREPFLDLILMASWSNGQLMREYTLLLDPPVFDDSQAVAPVKAAKTQSAAIDRGQKKVAAATAKPAPRAVGSYGPTTRTDTLWHVAREMRPGSSVSVPQMMMALLKENPDAFIDDNVNKLKAGH